ncbi:MAG: Sua5/YciO/YrdC/YwlC family protein [Candidatus Planktophila sp.]|jgi:L-threonylcarbamoyladenylate synthase|tara:strand:+ start:10617 stop:11261 length:645 start_codon:yes stop_codon:yes gene_type:complete
MAPRVDLKKGEMKKHVTRALKAIRDGYIIVVPLEHGYVYLADAFSPMAVRAMHVLRKDETGVASQVLAYSLDAVKGIARAVPPETQKLCTEFWPGMLSVTLKPSRSLAWDLGDNKELDRFNVRVPKSRFLRALLKESGPLAVASASMSGAEPMLTINRTTLKDWDVAVVFDNGALKSGQRTTIVEADETGIRLVREGAISLAEMTKVAPNLSAL